MFCTRISRKTVNFVVTHLGKIPQMFGKLQKLPLVLAEHQKSVQNILLSFPWICVIVLLKVSQVKGILL